jgi:hypothetical protein
VVRESPDGFYLYVVNTNACPLSGPSEADIMLAKPVTTAADVSVTPPVATPMRIESGAARLNLRLAQGEGALIRLAK